MFKGKENMNEKEAAYLYAPLLALHQFRIRQISVD